MGTKLGPALRKIGRDLFFGGFNDLLVLQQANVFECYGRTYRKWIAEKKAVDKDYFTRLAEGQNPEILYIGGASSRASREEWQSLRNSR